MASAPNGDLALQLFGDLDLLVLTADSDLSSSYTVPRPEGRDIITAFAWQGTDLIIAMYSGRLWRYTPGGQYALLGRTSIPIKRLSSELNTGNLLAITEHGHGEEQRIWRLEPSHPETREDLLVNPKTDNTLSALAATPAERST